MADFRNNNDPVEQEARDLTRRLDSGRQTNQVANALREDSYNMSPREFNRLVTLMQHNERPNFGDDIYRDRQGNVVIDTGNRQLVVATREFDRQNHRGMPGQRHDDRDNRGAYDQRDGSYDQRDGRYDQRDGRYGQRDGRLNGGRDAVTDGVVNGAIGAGVGAAIDGGRGAIAGGAGGIGNVIVDRVGGGRNDRDPVADAVVKGAIGAGVGAAIDGKKGAISGAAGSLIPNVLDRVINRHDR